MGDLSQHYDESAHIPREERADQDHYYGYLFDTGLLDTLSRHPLIRPSAKERAEAPEMADQEGRERAAAAIIRATRYACATTYCRQDQVDKAAALVQSHFAARTVDPSADDGTDLFFDSGVDEEIRAVVTAHFKDQKSGPTPPAP